MEKYLSVTTLTKYLKMKFDKDPYLERVYLTGQVSNFRKRPTHQYFSLKDDHAVIQATIWSGIYQKLGFDLEEGMKINVIGRVQIYESITLVLAFWSFPKWAEVGEKIFELVLSSTWTSSPMTVSKFISYHLQKSRVVVCGSLLLLQRQQQLGKWFPQSI